MTTWAFDLAERLLRAPLPRRWKHVQGVANRAASASGIFSKDDRSALIEAAVLHDIGYAPNLVATGFHPLDGALYLQKNGISDRVCALVAHHSCAYREAELRGLSAELINWTDEQTPLRDALWWADMTTSPDGEITNCRDRIEEIQERYGPEDLVSFFIRQASSDLMAAVERTESRLRATGFS